MKKICMRAGMAPTDLFDPAYILWENSIGNNVGNLLYAFGVNRTLSVEGTEVVPNYYKVEPSKAEEINEQYDAYIIPLADAFRPDFRGDLKKMTELVKKLTIPVIVIGVGLRAPFEPGLENKFPFDEEVREFVKAILEKSAMVGVRGEITAQYLSNLGFREGIDHTVIGCPSMYTYGPNLKIRDTKLTKDSMISINSSVLSPAHVHEFLHNTMEKVPNHYFLPQRIQELKMMYTGQPYTHKYSEFYPSRLTDKIYQENRVKYMLNVPTWLDFLKQADLSVGGRLHGNIAATIAGTPCILIPHDARMRELTYYHNLTHIWAKDIKADTDIFELFEKMDFHGVEKTHGKNFEHYLEFLDKNGLDHIYKNGANPEVAPLDKKVAEVDLLQPLDAICCCSFEEMVERWNRYYPEEEATQERRKSDLKALRAEVKQLNKDNKKLEKNYSKLEQKCTKLQAERDELKEKERQRKAIEDAKLVNKVKRKVKSTLKKMN